MSGIIRLHEQPAGTGNAAQLGAMLTQPTKSEQAREALQRAGQAVKGAAQGVGRFATSLDAQDKALAAIGAKASEAARYIGEQLDKGLENMVHGTGVFSRTKILDTQVNLSKLTGPLKGLKREISEGDNKVKQLAKKGANLLIDTNISAMRKGAEISLKAAKVGHVFGRAIGFVLTALLSIVTLGRVHPGNKAGKTLIEGLGLSLAALSRVVTGALAAVAILGANLTVAAGVAVAAGTVLSVALAVNFVAIPFMPSLFAAYVAHNETRHQAEVAQRDEQVIALANELYDRQPAGETRFREQSQVADPTAPTAAAPGRYSWNLLGRAYDAAFGQ